MKNLTLECSGIAGTSIVKRGEDLAHIKITLEKVRVFELMQSLIKEVGIKAILDHMTDQQIKNYLEGVK